MADVPPAEPADAAAFSVAAEADGDGFRIEVTGPGGAKSYVVPTATQQAFSAFYLELAYDFGIVFQLVFADAVEDLEPGRQWRPLLTENVHQQILVAYGDPAVLKSD